MAAEFRNVRIPAEAHERLQRLSALSGRSMSALIAAFSAAFELRCRQRLTEDVWARDCNEDISRAEAAGIRERVGDGGLLGGCADAQPV
jgi:hypothetical protein